MAWHLDFLVLQFTQVFKFGPHVQRGCAWEALHFATPGLAEKTPGWIRWTDFPLCEADVSTVRVNLSDSEQVQDLIVWRYFVRFGACKLANTVKQTVKQKISDVNQGDGTWDAHFCWDF